MTTLVAGSNLNSSKNTSGVALRKLHLEKIINKNTRGSHKLVEPDLRSLDSSENTSGVALRNYISIYN